MNSQAPGVVARSEWIDLPIEEIADVNPRVDKAAIPDDLRVSFVPMPAVGAGDGSIRVEETRPAGEVKKGFTAFLEGDVLFAKITPCMENGKMAVVPKLVNGYGFGSTEFHVLRPKPGMDAKYIYYYVSSQAFRNEAERYMTGAVGQKRVSTTYLKQSTIPVAPLDQQKRIVEEIEKQFSRLDMAVENLKRVKANLKRYKAAVLKAAVEGRLVELEAELARRLSACDAQAGEGRNLPTPRPGVFYVYAIRCDDNSIYIGHTDNLARRWEEHLAGQGAEWTKQHKPIQIVHYEEYSSRQEATDREKWLKTGFGRKWIKREIAAGRARQVGYETGAQLLQRILETRRQQWLARADKAGGTGRGKYKEPTAPDTSNLPELPEGWVWATMPQLGELNRGKSKHRPRDDERLYGGPYPFIQTGDVRKSDGVITEYSQMYSEFGLQQSRLWPVGTLCITIAANIAETGILKFAACFPDSVVGFLIEDGATTTQYVEYFIRTAREKLERFAPATAQKNINLEVLQAVAVPLPPLAEQHRIVAEIDRRLSLLRDTEAQVDANLKRAERMRQSILAKAFAGLLVQESSRTKYAVSAIGG